MFTRRRKFLSLLLMTTMDCDAHVYRKTGARTTEKKIYLKKAREVREEEYIR